MQNPYDIAIVGNGILGSALAERLKGEGLSVALIGPTQRPESASVAAAAMLNSYAEIGRGSLEHEVQRYKFSKSQEAAQKWPEYLRRLESESNCSIPLIDSTSLVLGGEGGREHMQIAQQTLERDGCNFELGEDRLTIQNEGALEPQRLFEAFDQLFEAAPQLEVIDDKVTQLKVSDAGTTLETQQGKSLVSKKVVLASGIHVQELCSTIPELSGVLQVFYGRGSAAHLYMPNHGIEHTHRTCHNGAHCGVYLIPYDKDHLYLGATSELMQSKEPREQRVVIQHLLDRAEQHLCADIKKAEIQKVMLGYRPTTADAFPLMGETSVKDVWVLSGTKRDGFHMAPVIVEEMAQGLLEGKPVFENRFLPERDLYAVRDIESMLAQAETYFESSRARVLERWSNIQANYPSLKSGIEVELWPLFEKAWVRPSNFQN